ncbi:RNA polymerase sigma factor [Paenibacillus dakarensis]|uniref:RNA polymerase sigma factor n=1 Tax=Paenibacillus dakarensis TaxID=1527293 RepID=UPI0006D53B7F|nr:RNA polymerase sigma factor [Paenibacillus dakarensis]
MSGAHDKSHPAYPDMQGSKENIEDIFQQYHEKIRKYFSFKLNPEAAEDLTQQVFINVFRNIHSFNQESSLFTWIFKIAQNTLKNEYRRISRILESASDPTAYESRLISLDFTKHVEIQFDISTALKKLSALDNQIIMLRFFVDCTFSEISEITGMRESAVKNRLYRTLEKLKTELKEWGDIAIMSIQNMISIVNKNEAGGQKIEGKNKLHHDLFKELQENVERINTKYEHVPTAKITIEIYSDLKNFHQAVGEHDAPNWFMGTMENNTLKIVSPLNPGPEHTYESILKSTVHLYAMWLISDINPAAPKWIRQGVGSYESKQMAADFIKSSIAEVIEQGRVPFFHELNNDTWDFGTMKGFQLSYTIIEFIILEYGIEGLNKLIRNLDGFQEIFHCTEAELYEQWVQYLKKLV